MSVDLLQMKIRKRKCPFVLRLAPSQKSLPPHLLDAAIQEYGQTLCAIAHAYKTYCITLLDSLCAIVPGVCVSAAPFFALGCDGVCALQEILVYAKSKDLYVVFDLMNATPPAQSSQLADSVFAGVQVQDSLLSPFTADCITLNGYHGSDSVRPWLPYCKEGKSVLLLVKSANKSGREVQELLSGGRVVYTAMADLAMRWSTGLFGENGYSQVSILCSIGNDVLGTVRRGYDRLFIFVDGLDAPSASLKHVTDAFDQFGHGAALLIGSAICDAWCKNETDGTDYLEQAKLTAEKLKADLLKYVVIL